jgi:hypothetical protein
MFFSGSAEPPSEVRVDVHKYKSPGAPSGEEGRLTARGYHDVLSETHALRMAYIRMCTRLRKGSNRRLAYAEDSCIDLAATDVAGTFLLLDLRPLLFGTVWGVQRSGR